MGGSYVTSRGGATAKGAASTLELEATEAQGVVTFRVAPDGLHPFWGQPLHECPVPPPHCGNSGRR